jgi:hypothetical protein
LLEIQTLSASLPANFSQLLTVARCIWDGKVIAFCSHRLPPFTISIINRTSLPGDYENTEALMAHFSPAFQFIIVFSFQPFPQPSISVRAKGKREIIHIKEREKRRWRAQKLHRPFEIKKGEFFSFRRLFVL